LKKARAARGQQKDIQSFLDRHGEIAEIREAGFRSGGERLGDAFVMSEGYKRIKSSSGRGQTWSSGAVEVPLQTKGTLLAGTAGGVLVPPYYRPGIVSQLAQPVGLADFFGQETTTSSHVR
jgi:hypothetical protein